MLSFRKRQVFSTRSFETGQAHLVRPIADPLEGLVVLAFGSCRVAAECLANGSRAVDWCDGSSLWAAPGGGGDPVGFAAFGPCGYGSGAAGGGGAGGGPRFGRGWGPGGGGGGGGGCRRVGGAGTPAGGGGDVGVGGCV